MTSEIFTKETYKVRANGDTLKISHETGDQHILVHNSDDECILAITSAETDELCNIFQKLIAKINYETTKLQPAQSAEVTQ